MDRPPRAFWQIWDMSFGFLGIQFGWGLPMANMSAIEYLRARGESASILRLAAPLTELIAQPIIGRSATAPVDGRNSGCMVGNPETIQKRACG
jgi:maltose/moltooligosaccharide transporter